MHWLACAFLLAAVTARAAAVSTASNNFSITLSRPVAAEALLADSANKPFAYARINNTERGLTQYDVFGTKRVVTFNQQRTGANPFPFGESPVYIVGPKGLKVNVRPDPGW